MTRLPKWVQQGLRDSEVRSRVLSDARALVAESEKGVLEIEEADDSVAAPHTGVMIALFPTPDVAARLAAKGGESPNELHVTLAFMGQADELTDEDKLLTCVQCFACCHMPLRGETSGIGLFTSASGAVTYASIDLPDLPEFRQELVKCLEDDGFPVSHIHGYTPHMTLAYGDRRDIDPQNVPLEFSSVTVAIAGVRHTFDLTGTSQMAADAKAKKPVPVMPDMNMSLVAPDLIQSSFPHVSITPSGRGYAMSVNDRPVNINGGLSTANLLDPPKPHPYVHPAAPDQTKLPVPINLPMDLMGVAPLVYPPCAVCGFMFGDLVHTPANQGDKNIPIAPVQRAFLTEAFGKTLITAPAHTWEKALSKNEHFLWMQGRFVGGEKANRNGAMWSSKDLELGQPTVAYGPLNWLHESKHIIGTIADAQLLPSQRNAETAAVDESHIMAMSCVWKWIYPEEAYVISAASDSGKLWYSMECISKNVECVGDGGCGEIASYGDYLTGNGCRHMREKSTVRRFDQPTFLGGAVIVPPVRPGWADANVEVMYAEAAALAEKTFEVANPQVSTNDWELAMGEVLKFAASL